MIQADKITVIPNQVFTLSPRVDRQIVDAGKLRCPMSRTEIKKALSMLNEACLLLEASEQENLQKSAKYLKESIDCINQKKYHLGPPR